MACTRKQQPRFYWSCSSVVMNDATPLTPRSAWASISFFSMLNRRKTYISYTSSKMYTPWMTKQMMTSFTHILDKECTYPMYKFVLSSVLTRWPNENKTTVSQLWTIIDNRYIAWLFIYYLSVFFSDFMTTEKTAIMASKFLKQYNMQICTMKNNNIL